MEQEEEKEDQGKEEEDIEGRGEVFSQDRDDGGAGTYVYS